MLGRQDRDWLDAATAVVDAELDALYDVLEADDDDESNDVAPDAHGRIVANLDDYRVN